jgi:Tfp pilus assembly protein PilV
MAHPSLTPRAQLRGVTLIEALVAVLVLSCGLLVVARWQPQLWQHAELSRQRSEAIRLAQQEIERARLAPTLSDDERQVDADAAASNTAYRVVREVDASLVAQAVAVDVTVAWSDRAGTAQAVQLASVVARLDPALSGARVLAPRGVGIAGPAARSIQIPLAAKDLGDGRSVLKPTAGATEAWVFDNRSGALTQRCTAIAAGTATRDLGAPDLSACTSAVGMVVSGEVHFSGALPPAADAANDAVLPLGIELALQGATPVVAPWCAAEAVATATERFVAYRCAIVPPAGLRTWSGRTNIVPSGWTIGTSPADWRICRYARDVDASGAVDANAEHPAIYQNVDRALHAQNFLVVRGNASCPTPADGRTEARLNTEPHQP